MTDLRHVRTPFGRRTGRLQGELATGFIPLDITTMREIATNDIQNLAAHGGKLASDSAPALQRVNGATDKALRVLWTAEADTDEAQFAPVVLPPDLDTSKPITLHALMAMEGASDSPAVDFQVFSGKGDVEMGGAVTVSGTAITEYTVQIAAANIGSLPGFLNISVVPAAHETDDLYLYASWLTYSRTA